LAIDGVAIDCRFVSTDDAQSKRNRIANPRRSPLINRQSVDRHSPIDNPSIGTRQSAIAN
jgi:hypothetical protein